MAAFNFFKRLHCDIIFLQETHWTAELENTINGTDKLFIVTEQQIPVALRSSYTRDLPTSPHNLNVTVTAAF